MKSVWIKDVILIGIAAVFGLVGNAVHPDGPAIATQRPVVETADDAQLQADLQEPVIIGREQVRNFMQQDSAVLVDARLPEEFEASTIPGAVNIPFERLGEYVDRLDALPKDKWIITFCDGPPCEKSVMLAYEIFNQGYPHVAIYYDGLEDWYAFEEDDS